MAKLPLSEGFSVIPKGEHTFKIISATYDEDFGKVEIGLVTARGQKHTERFNLIDSDGEINEKANNAFSYLSKTALNDFTLEEIDTDDLPGHYFKADVTHDVKQSTKDPNRTVTFAQLGNKEPADGFDEEVGTETEATPKTTSKKSGVNLDELLGK